jgi:hypothetical protein
MLDKLITPIKVSISAEGLLLLVPFELQTCNFFQVQDQIFKTLLLGLHYPFVPIRTGMALPVWSITI